MAFQAVCGCKSALPQVRLFGVPQDCGGSGLCREIAAVVPQVRRVDVVPQDCGG